MPDDTQSTWNDDDDTWHGDDGHDDMAALDFSVPDDRDDEDAEIAPPLFTVTNPPGSVSVTTQLDGRVHSVELGTHVGGMTERQLGEEIMVIADLARQKARSVAHAFMVDGMRRFGHDTAALSAGISRDLLMPTPEQAAAAEARVFATRYSRDDD